MKPPFIVAAKANEAMKNLTIASTREFVMISGSPKHAASDKAAPDKGLQPNMLLVSIIEAGWYNIGPKERVARFNSPKGAVMDTIASKIRPYVVACLVKMTFSEGM